MQIPSAALKKNEVSSAEAPIARPVPILHLGTMSAEIGVSPVNYQSLL